MKVRDYATVEEAVKVLGQHTTAKRLVALRQLGVSLDDHTHQELADAVCASREKVQQAMRKLGYPPRRPGRK